MFDIGFWELAIIGIVALLVIGPERLPAVARTAGKWVGKVNRFVATIKEDIDKEIKNEDLQNILDQQKQLEEEFKKVATQTKQTVNDIENDLSSKETTNTANENTLSNKTVNKN